MTLETLVSENKRLAIYGADHFESQIKGVHDAILELRQGLELELTSTSAASLKSITDDSVSMEQPDHAAKLTRELSKLAKAIDKTSENQTVLDSLWFQDMRERQANIANPHKKTFKWAFDEPSSFKFKEWLRTQHGIYWLRGKAGSGKSTLMKYLVNHPHTMEALKDWAGTHRLVTGSFFFWEAGGIMQKSQEGLFMSLLYEILRQCPELIHPVFGTKLGLLRRNSPATTPGRHRWTRDELWEIIESLTLQSEVSAQFCFFLDGLDEYDGEPDEITKVLHDLRRWPNIKLCVSCRPWNEFLDASNPAIDLHIALEDLTREDIKLYVCQTLEDNARFRALQARDSRTQSLLQEIVEKARGVFLWVVLVVRSLVTGLTNADKIQRLETRLRNFPETLEKFFDHMLRSVEKCYREDTALAFKYALEAEAPLSLMTFSFLDDDDITMYTTGQPLRPQEIMSRQDDMRRRLNGHCKGLLEVVSDNEAPTDTYLGSISYPKVEFLHRTVRDFLLSTPIQTMLSNNLPVGFKPKERLCKAYLTQLKRLDYSAFKPCPFTSPDCVPRELLEDLIFYAQACEVEVNFPQVTLMDDIGHLVYQMADYFQLPKTDTGFLEFLIHRRLYLYVAQWLTHRSHLSISTKTGLLATAMRPKGTKYFIKEYDEVMIEILLKHGASPNIDHHRDEQHTNSVWGDLLYDLNDRTSMVTEEPILAVIELFLQHGADPEKQIAIKTDVLTAEPPAAHLGSTREPVSMADEAKSAMQILHQSLPAAKAHQLQSEYLAKRSTQQASARSERDSSPERSGDEQLTPLPRRSTH